MRSSLTAIGAALVAASALTVSCGEQPRVDRSELVLFQTEFGAKAEPASAEMVALGRDLYHEKQLSTKKNLACASCHDLARYGQDGLPTSPGSDGRLGGRNSPTSVNAFRQFKQFWDGRADDVEAQAQGPVLNPIEHGFESEAEFLAALNGVEGVPARFATLFPGEDDPVTMANFGRAVGAFERTLTTSGRWEKYLGGDDSALTADETEGLRTFMDVGCATCHMGATVGGGMLRKLGERVPYETEDLGAGGLPGNAGLERFFKAPMLLNVAETAPYLHDGSVATLEAMVRLMGKHQLAVDLTDAQIGSIVTFLKALTGQPDWRQ